MNIALFAGIVASDGHLAKDRSTICVINKDKEFIDDVRLMIGELCGKQGSCRFVKSGFGSEKYLLRVNSAKLVSQLNETYSIPIGKKSLTIMPPKINQAESLEFLCGWIAGDGSVTVDRKRPKIEIWSKSSAMIEWFSRILSLEGIGSTIFEEVRKNEFILRIGRKESVKRFHEKFRIPHRKKQKKLDSLCS